MSQANSLDNYKAVLMEYGELRTLKKRCDDRLKELDKEFKVKELIAEHNNTVAFGFHFEVKHSVRKGSFDEKAMRDDGIDPDKYRKPSTPVASLYVKAVNT